MSEPPGIFGGEAEGAAGHRSLRGKFLLASPTLAEHTFQKTVVLLIRHDEEGALGLVVNRPLGVTLEEACRDEVAAARGVGVSLFHGGPCPGPLVAIHNVAELAGQADPDVLEANEGLTAELGDAEVVWAELVSPGVWFCTRREALEGLMRHVRRSLEHPEADDGEPIAAKFVAGYAGWAPGQLEGELREGSWLVADAAQAEIYAGGSPLHPLNPPTTSLPPGAIGLVALLAHAIDGGHDPTAGLAAGIRQWVRLSTRANLGRMIDPRLIPTDPSAN